MTLQRTDWEDVSQAVRDLVQARTDLPVKRAEQRWAAYVDNDTDLGLLAGTTLLHTNFNPLNVLLTAHGAWLIDWAWPTRGAAFIDPACFLLRLMLGGHTASQAEAWAAQCTSWERRQITRSMFSAPRAPGSTTKSPARTLNPWKKRFAAVAQDSAEYRSGKHSVAR